MEDGELKEILNHWKNTKLDIKITPNTWATDEDLFKTGRNYPFEACANFENEVDRVDYARYLFTGYIFAKEDSLQFRNVTMFSLPENIVLKKVAEENFFHTFDFLHPKFIYKQSLMMSVEKFMNERVQEITNEVQNESI